MFPLLHQRGAGGQMTLLSSWRYTRSVLTMHECRCEMPAISGTRSNRSRRKPRHQRISHARPSPENSSGWKFCGDCSV